MASRFEKPFVEPIKYDKVMVGQLFNYASTFDLEGLRRENIKNKIPLNVLNENRDNLIHVVLRTYDENVTEEKKLKMLEYLVSKGVHPDLSNNDGVTPLHIACENQLVKVVKFLMDCDVNTNMKDVYGKTPLHYLLSGLLVPWKNKKNKPFYLGTRTRNDKDIHNDKLELKKAIYEMLQEGTIYVEREEREEREPEESKAPVVERESKDDEPSAVPVVSNVKITGELSELIQNFITNMPEKLLIKEKEIEQLDSMNPLGKIETKKKKLEDTFIGTTGENSVQLKVKAVVKDLKEQMDNYLQMNETNNFCLNTEQYIDSQIDEAKDKIKETIKENYENLKKLDSKCINVQDYNQKNDYLDEKYLLSPFYPYYNPDKNVFVSHNNFDIGPEITIHYLIIIHIIYHYLQKKEEKY